MKRFLSSSSLWQTPGLTLVRILVGAFLIYHGSEIFTASKMNEYLQWDTFKTANGKTLVYLGKGGEFVAGILLATGFLTRIAALMMIGILGYISFFVGNGKIWYEDQYPFLFVILGFVFFFTGAGPISLDNLLFNKKR